MNIYDSSIEEIERFIGTGMVTGYWRLRKDIIDVCKDCEFRYMCTDERIPVKRNEHEWFFETECDYNPYVAKWKGEEGYRSLSESGVASNRDRFSIDHDRLSKINSEQ